MSDSGQLGILASLLDFSFTSFLTTKLIKILYALGFGLAALASVGSILGAFSDSFGAGLGSLIFVPLFFLIFVMYLRVMLEVLAVLFRIAEDVREIASGSDSGRPTSS